MGLLDSLFSQQPGGGLLDFLRQNAMNQQFGGGLPSDQAQYGQPQMQAMARMPQAQPSPLDTAQWPAGPMGAPSQAMAQMPQAATQQTPQPQGGFLQSLNENFQNMGNGGSLIGALTGQQPNNQTAQFLVSKGLDPAMAKTIVSDPGLLRSVLPSLLGTGGQTDDIKEYQFARREDPSLTFQKFMSQKKATSGEYSLNPFYTYNEKTKETEAWQLGKNGEPVKVKLPEGSKVAAGTDKVDAGTHWDIFDKRSGVKIGTMPKDLQGKEAAEERGKQQGQAQAKIPAALIDAEETTKKIDDLLKNDGLNSIVGSIDQYRPSWALGDSGRKALSQLEQLQGGAFLQAFNTLKGGGAITEIEGQKAERAIARMQRYQSENDFREALMDFRDAVKTGVRKLQAAASAGGAPAAPVEAPKRIKLNADGTIAQ